MRNCSVERAHIVDLGPSWLCVHVAGIQIPMCPFDS